MAEFRMPSLGADMDAGTLTEWLVREGARVARGDVVALVETEKGIIEIEIWEAGILAEIRVQPGAKVPVGTVLAVVRDEAAAAPTPKPSPMMEERSKVSKTNGASSAMTIVEPEIPRPNQPPAPMPIRASTPPTPVRASPAARQLAREHDIDLTKVHGTGPHDAVTRGDVERAVVEALPTATGISSATTPSPPPRTTNMRKAIAAAMTRSKREIPHYYLSKELDVSRAARWLEGENAKRSVTERIVFATLLLKATALALREVPELNGTFVDDAYRAASGIHIGVAIALRQGGLVAPALHDTDKKSVSEIMTALADLVARTRKGALRSSEMSDATITVTNLGDQGTDAVFGVIYPPQVAIVGFGTMRDRPWAEDGMLGVRPVVVASLAADHRVSDGHRGARFLATIARLLAKPEEL